MLLKREMTIVRVNEDIRIQNPTSRMKELVLIAQNLDDLSQAFLTRDRQISTLWTIIAMFRRGAADQAEELIDKEFS